MLWKGYAPNIRKGMTVGLLLTCLLTGCGGPGSDAANNQAAQPGVNKQKITFWKWIPTQPQMKDLEEEFERLNPDIDLVVKHIGESEAYFQKLAVGLASGSGPDIIAMQVGANANLFKSFLEPLLPYAEKTWGPGWESRFVDIALEQSRYSGADYRVIPGGLSVTPMILYNERIFQLYKLKPPKTYEELKHILQVLHREEPTLTPGIGIGAKDGWACRDVFLAIAGQVAPGVVNLAEHGRLPWTDARLVEAFRWWKQLVDDGIFMKDALQYPVYPQILNEFNNGRLAMMSLGSWHLGSMTRLTAGSSYDAPSRGMFPLPQLVPEGRRNVTVTVDLAWGMNNRSKHKEAVWRFIAFMALGEGQHMWTQEMLQLLPSAANVKVDEGIMNGTSERDALRMTVDYLEHEVSGSRELRESDQQQTLYGVLQALAADGITPEEAAASMQETYEKR
ncbi:ABC transporter substrate-binding protein [Paenibacillus solisilvae]|uniref:ABC transporter substrate-binding protein n=1 Tax=Paenibacillus solisilvae TaxID=2486751 RepID=A0ABW0W8A0_9BACL